MAIATDKLSREAPPRPLSRFTSLWAILALVSVAVVIALVSPPEKTLGNIAKFIYLHGALSWVGIATFTMAGVFGLVFLVNRKPAALVWSDAFEKTAILLWSIHFLMGLVSMQVAWGGIFWQEPRFLAASLILLISAGLYTSARAISKPLATAATYITTSIVTWGLLLNTRRVFHPGNPIMGSQSLNIKLYAAFIALFLLLASMGIAYRFKEASESVAESRAWRKDSYS